MEDGAVAQFVTFTSSTPETAEQYLQLTDGDVQQAIDLFFANDGNDAYGSSSAAPPHPATQPTVEVPRQTRAPRQSSGHRHEDEVVQIESDNDLSDDDEPQITGFNTRPGRGTGGPRSVIHTPASMTPPPRPAANRVDDDEAMARRLQEEFYGDAGLSSEFDPDGVRAPLARTTETLVGPESFDPADRDEMREAVLEQIRARQRLRQRERPGIFNQAPGNSIWNQADSNTGSSSHRDRLSRATAGASEASQKSSLLAEMYRPPFEIMSPLSWEQVREEGKEAEKWILVNVQDAAIFDCQILNRDIWKNPGIMETVKEQFLFMQFVKDDPRGNQYVQYYFPNRESTDAYPHIAIVDPRTGEQVKVWSGPPAPKAMDFLMQLHEFLERYSLKATAKNPVAKRKPEARKETQVEKMTEDQMLEMALQNSLVGTEASRDIDPDDLTRSIGNLDDMTRPSQVGGSVGGSVEGVGPALVNGSSLASPPSSFSLVSSFKPHTEPPPNSATSTRIQFRHPTGRVVRRFLLTDPVRTIYEWLKSSPLDGKDGVEFELIFMQKNLMEVLDNSIEQAGLQNGTVMVEFLQNEG